MAVAETARLIASLELKDLFSGKAAQIDKSLTKLNAGIDHSASRSYRAGQQIGTGIKVGAAIAAGAVGLLATNVALGLKSLTELESVTTQTNAVLKSTKGVAGETADSIRNLAEKYEALNATIDDKVIQSGENLLLTFTSIRKEAFEPALAAALDLSTAMGQDLQTSVVQVGKALQDPIRGITALRRVGVNFSTDQVKVIKQLVETGHTLEAQKLILKELNTEFGGSFLAGGNTTAGKVAKFKDAIEDLQKALATALLPVIGKVSDALSRFLADPKVTAAITKLGQNIAGLFSDENLAKGAAFLQDAFKTAMAAAPVLEQAAKATFGFVQKAVEVFKTLPAPLQGLLAGAFAVNKLTGGLVTNIGGALIDLIGKSRGATPANPVFVADVTGGLGGIGGAVGAAAGGVGVASVVTAVIAVPAAILIANALKQAAGITDAQQQFQQTHGQFGPRSASNVQTRDNDSAALHKALSTFNQSASQIKDGLAGLVPKFAGKIKDDLEGPANLIKGAAAEFDAATKQLAHPKSQQELVHAAQETVKLLLEGRGGAQQTANRIDLLRKQLSHVHDPKTRAALEAQLRKVEGLLPGRQFAARELAKADSILKSHQSASQKLTQLKAVEQALKDRGLPHAASVINAKAEAVKRELKAAENATRDAVRRKRLSVTVNNPVTVQTYVSTRTVETTIRKINRFGITVT